MALSLGVKEGGKLKIGPDELTVTAVRSPSDVEVMVKGKTFNLTDQERVEVLPFVHMFCGIKGSTQADGSCRLAIEAPIRIRIERIPSA